MSVVCNTTRYNFIALLSRLMTEFLVFLGAIREQVLQVQILNAVLQNIALATSPFAQAKALGETVMLYRWQNPTIAVWIGPMHIRNAQAHVLGG